MQYIEKALKTIQFNANSKSSTYYNGEGKIVPRVTEILDRMIHSDGLMYWANSLGMKGIRYRDFMNTAANIGTNAHNAIEKFLQEKYQDVSNIPFLGFMMWYTLLTQEMNLPIEVIYIEHKLSCNWFGGTLDALLKIGGKVYLVDFKTSNHVTFNYFLQLAAYKYMLKQAEGISVDGVIVLQLNKEEPGFNEYLLDFSIKEHLNFMSHCETTFLSLVYAFYNIYYTEIQFKTIFHGG